MPASVTTISLYRRNGQGWLVRPRWDKPGAFSQIIGFPRSAALVRFPALLARLSILSARGHAVAHFNNCRGQKFRHIPNATIRPLSVLLSNSSVLLLWKLDGTKTVMLLSSDCVAVSAKRRLRDDSDIVNSLASTIDFHFDRPDDIRDAFLCIQAICDYVLSNYAKFDVTADIYGDLRPQYEELRRKVVP